MDHRPVQDVGVRVADRSRFQTVRELRDELVEHRLVDDRGAERRAPLPRGAEAAEQRALDRQIDVGVVHHDHRVLAAELQARRLHVATAELADLRADRARPGEADLVDEALFQSGLQTLEGVRTRGLDEVQHARRNATRVEEPHHRVAQRGAVLGRLPDDGIAAQDRRHQVPRRHGDREVARGDDRRDTDRHPKREQLLVRHLRRHGLPVQPPALAEEEVARVDDLLHLAERLGIRLADLARDQRSKCLLVGLDQPADLCDHATAGRSRHRRPLLLRGACGARGVDERRRIAEQHLGDDVVGASRVRRGQAAAGSVAANLAADDRGDGGRGNGGGHGLHTSAAPTTLSGSRERGWRRDPRRA